MLICLAMDAHDASDCKVLPAGSTCHGTAYGCVGSAQQPTLFSSLPTAESSKCRHYDSPRAQWQQRACACHLTSLCSSPTVCMQVQVQRGRDSDSSHTTRPLLIKWKLTTAITPTDTPEAALNIVYACRFKSSEGVIVIAATNFPETLDKALVRPGRFDRHVTVLNPDVKGRQEILESHFKNVPRSSDVDLKVCAS